MLVSLSMMEVMSLLKSYIEIHSLVVVDIAYSQQDYLLIQLLLRENLDCRSAGLLQTSCDVGNDSVHHHPLHNYKRHLYSHLLMMTTVMTNTTMYNPSCSSLEHYRHHIPMMLTILRTNRRHSLRYGKSYSKNSSL